ncbi:MAG: membrane protein insertase YidC [Bacteroidales bacterium]|nr:membrane protein insertase YidC [Bacteroidales bacterium]
MKYREIIGFTLIFLIIIVFSIINQPTSPPAQNPPSDSLTVKTTHDSDSLSQAPSMEDSTYHQTGLHLSSSDSSALTVSFTTSGEFYKHFNGKEDTIQVENDVMKVTFSTKGAMIRQIELKDFLTYDKQPLKLYFQNENLFNVILSTKKILLHTEKLFFTPLTSQKHLMVTNDSLKLIFEALAVNETDSPCGKLIFEYVFRKDAYDFNFYIRTENGKTFLPPGISLFTLQWKSELARSEKHAETERTNSTIHYASAKLETNYLSERKNDDKKINYQLNWIAYKSQFFTSVLLTQSKPFTSSEVKVYTKEIEDPKYLKTMYSTSIYEFKPEEENSIKFKFFTGPLKYKLLRSYKAKLERQIPLGWGFAPIAWINRFAVLPVFNWLESYNLNYGIIILILTILLKIVLFPITYRTYLSSAKMRVLQPDIEAINKKFPKPEDAAKKQQAMMELYRRSGINPAAGCFPILLQLPILIAMFRFFPSAIELRQQPFLWAEDLSTYDSILDLGFHIPFYGDHVSLFTLLMTISTLVYTRLNEKLMSTGSQTLPGMRFITYLMPILFLGFFNSFSAALSYYYLLANLFTFVQIFGIRYLISEDKLRKQIEEHRKKPLKKSRWQQRLEEMQKQQTKKK